MKRVNSPSLGSNISYLSVAITASLQINQFQQWRASEIFAFHYESLSKQSDLYSVKASSTILISLWHTLQLVRFLLSHGKFLKFLNPYDSLYKQVRFVFLRWQPCQLLYLFTMKASATNSDLYSMTATSANLKSLRQPLKIGQICILRRHPSPIIYLL